MGKVQQYLLQMMGDARYAVTLRKTGLFKFPSNYRFHSHSHFDLEIDYVTSGSCIIEIDGEYITLRQGDCIILYPGVRHSFMVDIKTPCSLAQLEFGVNIPSGQPTPLLLLGELQEGKEKYAKISNCEEVQMYIGQIAQHNNSLLVTEIDKAAMSLNFVQVYIACSVAMEKMRAKEKEISAGKFNKVLHLIQERICEEVDMEKICARVGVSSRYIRRRFGETMGMNSSRYITLLRVTKAKVYLKNPAHSLAEIAQMVGFGTSQYFSRVFKSNTGETPTAYREHLLGQDNSEVPIL